MRERTKSHRARRSRGAQIGAVLTTGALLAVSIRIAWSGFDLGRVFSQGVAPQPALSHEGAIVFDGETGDCKSFRFDNDSGRIIGSAETCDDRVVLGADGKPVPLGTLHQMEAIRKSFRP